MTDYIDPADLPDGEHLALVRWSGGVESSRLVNRNGFRIAGFSPRASRASISVGVR